MRKPLFWAFAAVLSAISLAGVGPGAAASRDDEAVIAMSGIIHPGADEIFHTVVDEAEPDLVVVSGPGGDLGTALRIAAEVRRRGLATAIPPGEYCASACAVIFLSGRSKYIARGAKLGLHSASNLDGSYSREGTEVMGRFLAQMGVPAGVITRMRQRRGNDMYWLGDADKRALRIVAIGAALPRAAARPAARPARDAAPRLANERAVSNGCDRGRDCYRTLPNGVIMKVR